MPYIKQYDKLKFQALISEIKESVPSTPGELNYLITVLCNNYIDRNGGKYQQHNDVLGVLNAANQEFYRRSTAPYEDAKIKENGDVQTE